MITTSLTVAAGYALLLDRPALSQFDRLVVADVMSFELNRNDGSITRHFHRNKSYKTKRNAIKGSRERERGSHSFFLPLV